MQQNRYQIWRDRTGRNQSFERVSGTERGDSPEAVLRKFFAHPFVGTNADPEVLLVEDVSNATIYAFDVSPPLPQAVRIVRMKRREPSR